jgi:bis(5'-adenosyl)-triphosphatase
MNVSYDYKFGMFIIPKTLILHSSKYFFTMVPPNPVLKGHILICSKREVRSFSELLNEEIFDFSLTLQYISKMLEVYYKVNSSTISMQEGEEAGQVIPHFHAHLIPRSKGDLTNNDFIYAKLKTFDEDFHKEYTDLQSNLKNQLELKEEVDKFKEFMLKSYIY